MSKLVAEPARAWLFPERRGPVFSDAQRMAVRFYMNAADARIRCSREAVSPENASVCASLLCDAARCLLQGTDAAERSADGSPSPDPLAAFDRHALPSGFDPTDRALLRSGLAATDCMVFDRMDAGDLERLKTMLEDLVGDLRARLDLRSDAYLRGLRFGRPAGVLLLVVLVVVYAVLRLTALENVALHKPVRMSSQQPGTPDPSGLVDGDIGGSYGAHTQVGGAEPPFIIVDLLKVYDIRRIIVYNRGDTHLDDGLPYSVSASADGATFWNLATRENHFGSGDLFSSPWTIRCVFRARFVRIQARGYIALSELEVYAK